MSSIECINGVYDCNYILSSSSSSTCTSYDNIYILPNNIDWLLPLTACVAALMAYGLGANDSANSWGTSVGSKAISIRKALLIGGICEWLGAVSLGHGVSSTISKGVSNINDENCFACGYCNSRMTLYGLSMFGAVSAASIFLLIATCTAIPVSTTHAIVGGVVGGTFAATKFSCLSFDIDGGLGGIFLSWVLSPLLSGIIAVLMNLILKHTVFKHQNDARNRALQMIPILYGTTLFIMVMIIFLKSKQLKNIDQWIGWVIALFCAFIMYVIIRFYYVPYIEKQLVELRQRTKKRAPNSQSITIVEKSNNIELAMNNKNEKISNNKNEKIANNNEQVKKRTIHIHRHLSISRREPASVRSLQSMQEDILSYIDRPDSIEYREAKYCFKFLLVFQAALESFAHGANDTASATAAFGAVLANENKGLYACTTTASPEWVLVVGGFFVFLGVNTFGFRVIQTIGKDLVKINYPRGYCVEFGSTLSVVIATVMNMPVSTTHCQVGAIVMLGFFEMGAKKVDWALFSKIGLTWIISIPFSAGISAIIVLITKSSLKQ